MEKRYFIRESISDTGVFKIYARSFQNINPSLSKYTPIVFKIYGLFFRKTRSTSPSSDIDNEGDEDDVRDVTTEVTTRSLSGVEGELTGNDTTLSATQVGPRTVKSGLGGHDDGVSLDDEGTKTRRSRFRNEDDWHGQN